MPRRNAAEGHKLNGPHPVEALSTVFVRNVASAGRYPLGEQRRAAAVLTFAETNERVSADKYPGWRIRRSGQV